MTAEDAANVDGAKGRAVGAYDDAQVRVRKAHEKVERGRQAVAAAAKAADKQGSWPMSARALKWPSSSEVLDDVEELRRANDALNAARQDLRKVGLRPENWTG